MKTHDKVERDKLLFREQEKSRETGKKYRQAIVENERLERELQALLKLGKAKHTHTIKPMRGKDSESVAVLVASDWHLEEEVKLSKVNGLNEFNLTIARTRADWFFRNGLKLVQISQRDTRIKTIVLALLGDFISGQIHDELMESCQLRPVEAAVFATELLEAGINYLLQNSDCDIVIPCCVGNHSRITKKVHISTEEGNSLETFIYFTLKQKFENEKRVTFVIGEGYHTYLDILGYTVRFHHGHGFKYAGGIGGIFIPAYKAISQWNKAIVADLDIFGHWHQKKDGGIFICNGSLIGYSSYSLRIRADYEKPRQVFLLVNRDWGHTITAPIILEHA